VTNSGYIYCIGGLEVQEGSANCAPPVCFPSAGNATPKLVFVSPSSSVYFAEISSSGVGVWQRSTSYPFPIVSTSCVIFSDYIYCVSGIIYSSTGAKISSNSSYYASVSTAGVGEWRATTSYPSEKLSPVFDLPPSAIPCESDSGYIYCIGGTEQIGSEVNSSVYYASLSANGIGTWQKTANYPEEIAQQSCVLFSGSIYCIGGGNANGLSSFVEYATLSDGVKWASESAVGFSSESFFLFTGIAVAIVLVLLMGYSLRRRRL
jgi:hypothetical protein